MFGYYGYRYRCCIDSKLGSFEIDILSFEIHEHMGLARRSCTFVTKVCDALKETTEKRQAKLDDTLEILTQVTDLRSEENKLEKCLQLHKLVTRKKPRYTAHLGGISEITFLQCQQRQRQQQFCCKNARIKLGLVEARMPPCRGINSYKNRRKNNSNTTIKTTEQEK